MLSEKAIQQFKKLYERRFNEKLSNKEAFHKANNLLNLYRAIYGSSFCEPTNNNQLNKMTINPNENDYANRKTNY